MADMKAFFDQALDQATAVIMQVRDADLSHPTPCTEWNVQSLANHMLYELLWVPEIVEGKTIAEVGSKYDGDLMIGVWQDRWKAAADSAREAVSQADLEATAHLSFGDIPVKEYLEQISSDLFIHGWDLGEGINQPVKLPDEVSKHLYDFMKQNEASFASSGLFGTPQPVATDADQQTRLLAAYGRRLDWRPA
jgi:uncharacterized protein (TIGR03086 family)